jgi:hypothetical protein
MSADDLDAFLREITPYRWNATCPKCRRRETITSSDADDPESEVCSRCGNGVMKWVRVQ